MELILRDKIPTMTSNTTPSGECFASGDRTNCEAYKAFNKVTNNDEDHWVSPNDGKLYNVGYKFPSPIKINCIKIFFHPYYNGKQYIQDLRFNIMASVDGETWDMLKENCVHHCSTESVTLHDITPTKKYQYYRLDMLSLNNSFSNGYSFIHGIYMYGY